MKKYTIYIILLISIISFSGCRLSKSEDMFFSVFDELYASDFSYIKSDTLSVDNEQITYIYNGEVTSNPYTEHVSVEQGEALWQEIYYSGEGEYVNAKISVDGEWQEQKTKREFFYGYGEDIRIVSESETTLDGIECVVYYTEYTEVLGDDNALEADIIQEYYIEKESGKLCRIVTDITELQRMIYIANDMSANGTALEEAVKNADEKGTFGRIEDVSLFW